LPPPPPIVRIMQLTSCRPDGSFSLFALLFKLSNDLVTSERPRTCVRQTSRRARVFSNDDRRYFRSNGPAPPPSS
jgi:hypothetical protein